MGMQHLLCGVKAVDSASCQFILPHAAQSVRGHVRGAPRIDADAAEEGVQRGARTECRRLCRSSTEALASTPHDPRYFRQPSRARSKSGTFVQLSQDARVYTTKGDPKNGIIISMNSSSHH